MAMDSSQISTSTSIPSPTATAHPAWHFPFGPSSRYHQSERPKSHTRFKSSYTPTAPSLSTERRAHRRTRSSASTALSPPASDNSSIRSPLSRFSSYTRNNMPTVDGMPVTPAKHSRPGSSMHDSPFSDYFTDESARSVQREGPSFGTQQLLVRLHKLQSQLMGVEGDEEPETIHAVGRKLSEIEYELNTVHSHTRRPPDIGDSGLFMDESFDDTDMTPAAGHFSTLSRGVLDEPAGAEKRIDLTGAYKAERDGVQAQLANLLNDLGHLRSELHQRYTEVREINERHAADIEARDEQIEHLRLENEGLRSDLGFEYSELLFLKLQMKSLEVQISDIGEDTTEENFAAIKERRVRRNRILAEIEGWRTDWQDVRTRCQRRRSRYSAQQADVQGSDLEADASLGAEREIPSETDWQLQTINEREGRITSLTLTRVNSNPDIDESSDQDQTRESESERRHRDQESQVDPVPSPPRLNRMSSEQGTQTDSRPPPPSTLVPTRPSLSHQGTQTDTFGQDTAAQKAGESSASTSSANSVEKNQGVDREGSVGTDLPSSNCNKDSDLKSATSLNSGGMTAWQELWDSLSNLAGMGDDRF